MASPRRILSTPVFFPCAWSRRHLGLRAARATRHRESQRVERAGFGLRHGRLRAHHSAYTPLPEAWRCAVVFNCKAVVKSFKQFRAHTNWFVLNRLCGCSASRARLGTKAHFGDAAAAAGPPPARVLSCVTRGRSMIGDGRAQCRLHRRWLCRRCRSWRMCARRDSAWGESTTL